MPKVKAPYRAVDSGLGFWSLLVDGYIHIFYKEYNAKNAERLAKEAYAHGYRNGVRKRKK